MTRDGHTLFDFAHLEAEIIAHVIAPQLASARDFLTLLDHEGVHPLGTPDSPITTLASLLSSLDVIASRCLFNPSQPRVPAGGSHGLPGGAQIR